MLDALGIWERSLHERGDWPDLIQCGLLHEQFESIHPFLDGNGRIGRLLIILFLIERGRLSQPLLSISASIEANRQRYYDTLQAVRTDCDWDGWLLFFLATIAETARAAVRQIGQILDLRQRTRQHLRDRTRALALFDALLVNPYLTVPHAAELLGVTAPTARQAVQLLQREGILEELPGRTWRRVYVARPILAVLERPSADH